MDWEPQPETYINTPIQNAKKSKNVQKCRKTYNRPQTSEVPISRSTGRILKILSPIDSELRVELDFDGFSLENPIFRDFGA